MIDKTSLIYPRVNQLYEADCLDCMKQMLR